MTQNADGTTDIYTYNTAEIQPDLAQCTPGDSVTFQLTSGANMVQFISVNKSNTIKAIYDLTGEKLPAIQRGVNIILYSDGTRRKVVKK